MTENTPTRRDLLRPLHLLAIAAGAGLFAGFVTFVTTGGFQTDVYDAIAAGNLEGMPPILVALIVAGVAFIATLLILSMLLLAVNPADVTRKVDGPVLYDSHTGNADAAAEDAASDTP